MANLEENTVPFGQRDVIPNQPNEPINQSDSAMKIMIPRDNQKPKNELDEINDDDLSVYISNLLRNDISDKEEAGWTEKRIYDINAYEGNKLPTNFPWVNCCNFPQPLTPTLVDTAWANIMGSIFADPENTVDVQGVGVEDIRLAPILMQLLNFQINKEIEAYEAWDRITFLALRE